MANKTIKQLSTEHTTALADDWLLVQKDATSVTGKMRMSNVFDGGWKPFSAAPNTVTALGNNSFQMVYNSLDLTGLISNGMRQRFVRTVAAPNTAFSLDGTNDYYVKTSPNKLTFTDDFVCSAWVYLTAYQTGAIVSRYNGTSGFEMYTNSSGQVTLLGHNAGSGNYRGVVSYQSVPLNRWVHVAAQMDMSTYTATTTTCYVMIDGVDVPAVVTQAGTNPTAFIQAGNLEVGSSNGGTIPFAGYLDQVAVYSAKVTQATILASINRALSGSETSLASAYSNGSVNDLNTTTPNNLTATNGATTVANSPFGNRGVSTTLEYGVVMANTFSTNTTLTIQVPEGCQLPTTGGISSVDYSTQNVPYGFPRDRGRYRLSAILKTTVVATASSVTGTWYYFNIKLPVPIGAWMLGNQGTYGGVSAGAVSIFNTMSTSTSAMTDGDLTQRVGYSSVAGTYLWASHRIKQSSQAITTMTPYYLLAGADAGSVGISVYGGANTLENGTVTMFADNAYI